MARLLAPADGLPIAIRGSMPLLVIGVQARACSSTPSSPQLSRYNVVKRRAPSHRLWAPWVAGLFALALAALPAGCGGDDGSLGPDGGLTDGGNAAPDAGADPCEENACRLWCDPATWGGQVPDASTEVILEAGKTVVVNCDAVAKRIEISEGATLVASREVSSTLTIGGNLVVFGTLDYGTAGSRIPDGITAEIIFTGMTDDQYAGTPSTEFGSDRGPSALTPMEILETDVGLWIGQSGTWTAAGTAKRAWGTLLEGTGPGDPTFEVDDASGWQVGDAIALTPTAKIAEDDSSAQFDEGIIAAIDGNLITLEAAPEFSHTGCTDCLRRGEAINLTRNVIIRSADDTAHAHIMVFDQAKVTLDSVELKWLGPEQCGGPARRAALSFHQQEDAAASSIKHTVIHGGDRQFIRIERSHGIAIEDVAGYDTYGSGFVLGFDPSACGTRCTDRDSAPRDILFQHVIAAKVAPATREQGCLRIDHRAAGFSLGGGENTGCVRCVATGIGYEGSGADLAGFSLPESGAGRPQAFTFEHNVAHSNGNHGMFVWHNATPNQAPWADNAVWSNEGLGIHWGAYSNSYALENFTAVGNGRASIGIKAVPTADRVRFEGGTVDDIRVLSYVVLQTVPNIIKNVTFTGDAPIGVTQIDQPCTNGNPNDPDDPDCLRVWLRFVDPVFPAGMKPFVFGDSINKFAVWEVRGFSSPDYPDLPANFDLYRRDNQVAGGSYFESFDAWLVPR